MRKKEASNKPAPQMNNNLLRKDTDFPRKIKIVMEELHAVCPRSGEVSLYHLIKKGGEK